MMERRSIPFKRGRLQRDPVIERDWVQPAIRFPLSLLALALFLSGCAAAGSGGAGGAGGTGPMVGAGGSGESMPAHGFMRSVVPFDVVDEHGDPYAHPFLGGFVVPRPQFVDIDGDGDLDLFVHERSNELMYLENVGTARVPRYEWHTDQWQGLETGEWSRFVDLDDDGLVDLVAEELFSYIRVYRNEGTAEVPVMVHVPDSLRDDAGRPIFADRQNIPAFHDLDADGRLDLFLGRIDGTVGRYSATGETGPEGLPRFRLVTERFEGIEIVGALVAPSLHGANSMFFADADGDGLADLFWGDFFEAGILLMENRGNSTNPSITNVPIPVYDGDEPIVTSGFNAPTLADVDDDGAMNLFIGVLGGAFNPIRTAADNFHHYRNDGEGRFDLETRRFLHGIDVGSESVPAIGDMDGDGKPDILVGNKIDPDAAGRARLYWFRSTGSVEAPRFQLQDTIDLVSSYHYAPAVAPLWGEDALPGLVLGTWSDGLHFYRNRGDERDEGDEGDEGETGSPRFEHQDGMTMQLSRGSNGAPAVVDLDDDGLLDLVVGRSNGELSYYRNVGSASEPRFEFVSDQWMDIRVGRRAHPAFVDLTGDGLLDLVVGQEAAGATVFRNVGSRVDPAFEEDPSLEIRLHPYGAPTFGDLTGDGNPELIAGGASGGLIYFERR